MNIIGHPTIKTKLPVFPDAEVEAWSARVFAGATMQDETYRQMVQRAREGSAQRTQKAMID